METCTSPDSGEGVIVRTSLSGKCRQNLVLGIAVLLISLLVVGLIHIGSTAPDAITKLKIYVNPEASRICTLARNSFSICIAVAGLLGFLTCLARCVGKKKIADEGGGGSSFGLSEASNLSYALHSSVLVFICIVGIVSRQVTIDPGPGILIELTPCEVANNHAVSTGSRLNDATRQASVRQPPKNPKVRSRATSRAKAAKKDEPQVQKENPSVFEKEPLVVQTKSEAPEVVAATPTESTQEKPTPEVSATTIPYVTAGARPRSFIVPNYELMKEHPEFFPDASYTSSESTSAENASTDFAKEGNVMGFNQCKYLTSFFSSGNSFGVICRDSILENDCVSGDEVEIPDGTYAADIQRRILRNRLEGILLEPELVQNTFSLDSGYLPLLSKRRTPVNTGQAPVPMKAHQESAGGMPSITPNVPKEPAKISQPEVKVTHDCEGSCPSYMTELQRRIKRCWFPPRVCTAPKSPIAKVHFSISSSGELSNLKLFKSSGVGIYDVSCLKAVENASPMRALPPGGPDKVDIEFTFDLKVLGFYKNVPKVGIDDLVTLGPIKSRNSETSDRSSASRRSKTLDLSKIDTFALAQHINRRLSRVWAEPKNHGWVTLQYVIHRDGGVTNVRMVQSSGAVLTERAAETALINACFDGVGDPPGRRLTDHFDSLNCDSALVETQFRGIESSVPRIQSNIVELAARVTN